MIYLIQRLPLAKSTKTHHLHLYKYAIPQRYTPPTSHNYSTDSQETPYLLTSISFNIEPQSSPPFISLPILPGGILLVMRDLQQCQPSDGIPILLIPNHFKLHPCSYICTTIDLILEVRNLDLFSSS